MKFASNISLRRYTTGPVDASQLDSDPSSIDVAADPATAADPAAAAADKVKKRGDADLEEEEEEKEVEEEQDEEDYYEKKGKKHYKRDGKKGKRHGKRARVEEEEEKEEVEVSKRSARKFKKVKDKSSTHAPEVGRCRSSPDLRTPDCSGVDRARFQRLKLKYDEALLIFALNFELRSYIEEEEEDEKEDTTEPPTPTPEVRRCRLTLLNHNECAWISALAIIM